MKNVSCLPLAHQTTVRSHRVFLSISADSRRAPISGLSYRSQIDLTLERMLSRVSSGQEDAIELVDTSGRVRWSATFAKRLTHVAADGDTLVCVAGALAVFRRVAALVRRPSGPLRSHDRVGSPP